MIPRGKSKIISYWILLSLVSISVLQQVAVAQVNKKYVPYENLKLGFRISYPSGWLVLENPPSLGDTLLGNNATWIYLGPPDKLNESLIKGLDCAHSTLLCTHSTTLTVEADNVSKYLDTNTLTVKSRTAHDYALDQILGRRTQYAGAAGDYIRDMPVTVGATHIPGWRVDSMYPGEPGYNNSEYEISTYVVANSKEYVFIYGDNPLKVPETLPIMQAILNSFQVLK